MSTEKFSEIYKKGIKKKPADKYLGLDDCLKRLLLEIAMQYPCNYLQVKTNQNVIFCIQISINLNVFSRLSFNTMLHSSRSFVSKSGK